MIATNSTTTYEYPELYKKIYNRYRYYANQNVEDYSYNTDYVHRSPETIEQMVGKGAVLKYDSVLSAKKQIKTLTRQIKTLQRKVDVDTKRLLSPRLRSPREELEDENTIRKITIKRWYKELVGFERVVKRWM